MKFRPTFQLRFDDLDQYAWVKTTAAESGQSMNQWLCALVRAAGGLNGRAGVQIEGEAAQGRLGDPAGMVQPGSKGGGKTSANLLRDAGDRSRHPEPPEAAKEEAIESRSRLKRIAALKGEPAPDFSDPFGHAAIERHFAETPPEKVVEQVEEMMGVPIKSCRACEGELRLHKGKWMCPDTACGMYGMKQEPK